MNIWIDSPTTSGGYDFKISHHNVPTVLTVQDLVVIQCRWPAETGEHQGLVQSFAQHPLWQTQGCLKKNNNEKTKWKGRQLHVTGHQARAVSWCIYGDNVPKQFISRKAGSELCFLLLEAHTDDTSSRSLACLATMEGILPCRQRPSVPPLAYLL